MLGPLLTQAQLWQERDVKTIDRLFVYLSDLDGYWLERLSLSLRPETKNNDDAIIVATHDGDIYHEELDTTE